MESIATNQSPPYSVTSCKNCSFSVIEDGVQTGCKMRYMDPSKYFYVKEDGVEHRIFKRLCQFKRERGDFTDDLLKEVKNEVKIKYNLIINFNNPDLALQTINSIKEQVLKPEKLILVCYQKYGDRAQQLAQDSGFKWVVHEIFDDLIDWRDDVMQKFPAQFYAFIQEGIELDSDYFYSLNDAVNFQDLRFGCIKSERLLIFPHGLYKMIIKPVRVLIEEMESLGFKILNEDFSSKE